MLLLITSFIFYCTTLPFIFGPSYLPSIVSFENSITLLIFLGICFTSLYPLIRKYLYSVSLESGIIHVAFIITFSHFVNVIHYFIFECYFKNNCDHCFDTFIPFFIAAEYIYSILPTLLAFLAYKFTTKLREHIKNERRLKQMSLSNLSRVWQTAALDLNLKILSPYEFTLPSGNKIKARLLLKNYGYHKGMLVFDEWGPIKPFAEEIVAEGYGYSVFPDSGPEREYDRNDFIELFSDWGWSGDKDKEPSWLKTGSCRDLPLPKGAAESNERVNKPMHEHTDLIPTATIYIRLLDEGTNVFRPAMGEFISDLVYRILPTKDYDPEDEHWEFSPESVVKCVYESHDNNDILVAKSIMLK